MKTLRPYLSAILGVVLLLQGGAVAAAPRAVTSADPVAAAVGTAAATDCHGQPAAADADPAPCCDAGCPDMTTCSMGHLGVAPVATLHLPAAEQAPFVAALPATAAVAPSSLLRPPIDFPA